MSDQETPLNYLRSLHIAVRDLERSIAFYRDGLGLRVEQEGGSTMAVAYLRSGTKLLLDQGLGERMEVTSTHPKRAPHMHIHLEVPVVEVVKSNLREHGHPVYESAEGTVGMNIFVTADPDGHNYEVFST